MTKQGHHSAFFSSARQADPVRIIHSVMNAHKTNSLIDLLKFVFALAIVVHHIEQYRASCGFVNYWENATIISFGKTSIIFFFVLSGYLVTNSFLRQATFDIKKFYKRRLLRIAPLYYILVCCSIFIFPNINLLNSTSSLADTTQNLLYFLFLPNIVLAAFPANPFLAHTWFVGTTEQYHFLSALCYKYSKSRQTYAFLLMALVAIYWAFGLYVKIFAQESFAYTFWHYFNIDCLAIGAIFALLPKEGKWISFLKKKVRIHRVSTRFYIFTHKRHSNSFRLQSVIGSVFRGFHLQYNATRYLVCFRQ